MALRHRVAAALVGAVAALSVGGCTPATPVDPAPYAADPDCARIMLAAPSTLGGLPMRTTTSQATAAYGDEYIIVVRCGVEPPGPTTDQCVVVDSGRSTVGWLVTDDGDGTEGFWHAVSFGLSPAVEAIIPRIRADEAVGDLLAELTPSAALGRPNGLECR